MTDEVRITLRLPASVHGQLVSRAQNDRRSLNSEIVHLLEVGLSTTGAGTDSNGSQSGKK